MYICWSFSLSIINLFVCWVKKEQLLSAYYRMFIFSNKCEMHFKERQSHLEFGSSWVRLCSFLVLQAPEAGLWREYVGCGLTFCTRSVTVPVRINLFELCFRIYKIGRRLRSYLYKVHDINEFIFSRQQLVCLCFAFRWCFVLDFISVGLHYPRIWWVKQALLSCS